MKNLIEYWLESATKRGEPLAAVLREVGAEVGIKIPLSRFSEWRRGVRGLPREVQRQMLSECLPGILREHGIRDLPAADDEAAYESLVNAMMPPEPSADSFTPPAKSDTA
jgi:hypothetical protein